MKLFAPLLLFILILPPCTVTAQEDSVWHNQPRTLHYAPEGKSFVLKNGTRKFNRALYGTNTGFRVETGDLPEFALYMPGMGGNFKLGIISGNQSKWITDADDIKTVYTPGIMEYTIKDELLGNGNLQLTVAALADNEGLILKVVPENLPNKIQLVWVYGGATGKKFHRDGDIGADPESVFYLLPEYCAHNEFELEKEFFTLNYGWNSKEDKNTKKISATFPPSQLQLKNANSLESPLSLLNSNATKDATVLMGTLKKIGNKPLYWKLQNAEPSSSNIHKKTEQEFNNAIRKANEIASRVVLETPDPYLNTLGGALATAADGIWESPAYLHGAVAWRMHLNAWRGAYCADLLGWHNRAESHFLSYSNSQVLEPASGPVVPDTARYFARQKEVIGTAMFSEGYISRHPNKNTVAHHYDMNLVFIDQLLKHIQWTGDIDFLKQTWPVIKRHLAWEKRNYDTDNDGLYDAYASIWASDALQYSGGGVTYTSAYNYKANTIAAQLAVLMGEDPTPYKAEAKNIHNAIQQQLWVQNKGVFAEYKDLLGNQLVHETPGVWTIYHALDKNIGDPFQGYQAAQYVSNNIPHIPIKAEGLPQEDLFLISTSNWQPYTWSVNNVALAESLNTALAYWQAGDSETAFKLWESSLIESMYLSASPGNFEQLSFYDAMRGELYRDFADPIGVASRTLVEGLFGIKPDALNNTLTIAPGLPESWPYATLKIPDMEMGMRKEEKKLSYTITPHFPKKMPLRLEVKALYDHVKSITVNGKEATYELEELSIGVPILIIHNEYHKQYNIEIVWDGKPLEKPEYATTVVQNQLFELKTNNAKIIEVKDPQGILKDVQIEHTTLTGTTIANPGNKTMFVKLTQGQTQWWQPVNIKVAPDKDAAANLSFENWKVAYNHTTKLETVDLTPYFNSPVDSIFRNQYFSPRPTSPTLQLPTTGIGNWCYPTIADEIHIDDSGLRKKAGEQNNTIYYKGVPFKTPSELAGNNIAFTSQWDVFPNEITIPLQGNSSHIYLMMAGTTNHMQSRIENGRIEVAYNDGTQTLLPLKNPENWWPIEQDYYADGYAFTTDAPKPPRVYFKTGEIQQDFKDYTSIHGLSSYGVEGGAGTILDIPLDPTKTLKNIKIKTIANDVIIGLMSLTLKRD